MSVFLYRHSRKGFTLIELIVGMTIFAIGLTGILALLSTTITNSSYSRHEIVVAGLLREQMELVKNIRDTNLQNYTEWDKIYTENVATSTWLSGTYIIENNFNNTELVFDASGNGNIIASPVYLRNITTEFSALPSDDHRFEKSRLYLDEQGRYTHTITATGTVYAAYMMLSPLGYETAGIFYPVSRDSKNQGYIIDARVMVRNGNNYREYDAKTAITDWVK